MILFICSKAIKKEKFKEEKEVPKPKKSPSPISIDNDDNPDMVAPWLSAGSSSVSTKGSNSNKSLSDDEHGATLIVCPLSVLSNWTVSVENTLFCPLLMPLFKLSPPPGLSIRPRTLCRSAGYFVVDHQLRNFAL